MALTGILYKRGDTVNQDGVILLNKINKNESGLADKSSHYVTLADFKRLGGETDDTARINRAIAYAKANSIGLIIFPKATYTVTQEIAIDFGDIQIEGCDSTILYTGSNSYAYTSQKGVLKFIGSVKYSCTDGVLSYTPRIAYSDNIKKGYSTLEVTQTLYDNVSDGDYLYITINTLEPPYTNAETPTARVLARVFKKDTGNTIIIDYDSPFNWAGLSISSQIIKVVNPIKNISIRDLNISHADSNLQMIAGFSLLYCSNFRIEGCSVEKHHLPAYWVIASELVTTNNCIAKFPQYTSSGQGYHTQVVDSQNVLIQNGFSINCRHTVDFSGGAHLRAFNMKPQINADNPTVENMINSFDCHGICEHDIIFDNCDGNYVFGNGRTQFVELTDNVKLINCDVKNLYSTALRNVTFHNCELSFDQGTAVYLNRVRIENCTLYANTLGLIDFRGDYRTPHVDSFFKMSDCFVKFLDIGDFGSAALAWEQIRFLNYNRVYIDNIKTINDVTNNINFKATCDVFEITNSRIKGYVRTLCTKQIKINNNYFSSGNVGQIYIDNTNLSGLVNIEIKGNTFEFASSVRLLDSNAQGASTLKNLVRFQDNTVLNNGHTVDYYLQSYANLTWKVISKQNAVMVALTKYGASQELFPDADSAITI